MDFFTAIADADTRKVCGMLNGGFNPDTELPQPAPQEFIARFEDARLKYYLSSEKGFTPLMLATSLGSEVYVRILLAAGAAPNKMTRRHKTFALWLAGKYGHLEIMRLLMNIGPEHEARRMRIEVDLGAQRAALYRGDSLIEESPISTGKKSHPTPQGSFLITNKYEKWTSSLYHAKMPHFMRLSCGDFGLHAGALPGRPASHGCIRLPAKTAKSWFQTVPEGTLVVIR